MDWYKLSEEVTIVSEFYSIITNKTTREYNCAIHVKGNVPTQKRYEIIIRRFEDFRKNLTNVFVEKVKEYGYFPKEDQGKELEIKNIFKLKFESYGHQVLNEGYDETIANFYIILNVPKVQELPIADTAMRKALKQLGFDAI